MATPKELKPTHEEIRAARLISHLPSDELEETIIEAFREAESAKARLHIYELGFKHLKERVEELERQRDAYRECVETLDEVIGHAKDGIDLAHAISQSRLSVEA